jgi:hypothetical protein
MSRRGPAIRCAAVDGEEQDPEVGGAILRVREAGDPDGSAVLRFHRTPSCRPGEGHSGLFDHLAEDLRALASAASDRRFGR